MKKIFLFLAIALAAVACEDVPMPYEAPYDSSTVDTDTTESVEPEGDGTADNPYNVAAALELISAMSSDDTTDYIYVKGIINSISEVSTSYGNATYSISDDGTAPNTLYVYRSYSLGGNKFTSEDEIQEGDEVIIYGQFQNYYGTTPETVTNKSWIYSLNGSTSGSSSSSDDTSVDGDESGDGTLDNPYNVVAAINLISALDDNATIEGIYVKGIIAQIKEVSTSYGNATFYISDDGTTTTTLYIYRCYSLGNNKFTSSDEIAVGDEVVIYGTFVKYVSSYGTTPESSSNSAYIYTLNGSTEGTSNGSSDDTSDDTSDSATTAGVNISGTTVTLVNGDVTAGSTSVTLDLNDLDLDNEAEATTYSFDDGTTVTFDIGSGSNTPKYYTGTKGIRVYANNTVTISASQTIATIVFTCDTYNSTAMVGNDDATVAFDGNSATYTNVWTGSGGGTQLRVQTITVTYAE